MSLATRTAALQANMGGIQWYPQKSKPLFEKRAPHSSCNPMIQTLTQQNPWWKTRTVHPQTNVSLSGVYIAKLMPVFAFSVWTEFTVPTG
jgi:hypothetical protein